MRRSRRRSVTEQGSPDFRTLTRVLPDLWPAGRRDLRLRVVAALILLVAAKGATIVTPFFYRDAVDALTPGTGTIAIATAVFFVVAYGVARLSGTVLQQARDMIFSRVSQHALRGLANRTFAHVHRLSLGYHLSRRTGELSRVVDRGIKAISFTGGEPLLDVDHLIELIHRAGDAGIPFIRTGTNGFVFRHPERADFNDRIARLADRLAATPLRNFWVSLDSADAAEHDPRIVVVREEQRGTTHGEDHGIEGRIGAVRAEQPRLDLGDGEAAHRAGEFL